MGISGRRTILILVLGRYSRLGRGFRDVPWIARSLDSVTTSFSQSPTILDASVSLGVGVGDAGTFNGRRRENEASGCVTRQLKKDPAEERQRPSGSYASAE